MAAGVPGSSIVGRLSVRGTSLFKLLAAGMVILVLNQNNACIASPSEPTMAEMQWHRRVLIISTPRATDREYVDQQRALSQWTGGDERDVTVVSIAGAAVSGSRESAAELRDRYHIPSTRCGAVLIGKDGHVALRSQTVLSGAQLEGVIDAMPMRKAHG